MKDILSFPFMGCFVMSGLYKLFILKDLYLLYLATNPLFNCKNNFIRVNNSVFFYFPAHFTYLCAEIKLTTILWGIIY